ncbi:oxidoreductase OpS5-like [Anneissia japonica]|uniref:oxidoreductase OpS5-like n=1 Tax=Anneissia japonica TaxID=1529436 RepID=UPI0014258111|nr:oxidoreductase OpS5-like [Anneissia japonica]
MAERVCHGDTIRVKVNNQLADGGDIAIHWHGIHQFQTVWMDGVAMITQCPIPFATSFVYKFVADPPGTHWWHSHTGVQRGEGMYGPLIVRSPKTIESNSNLYDVDILDHVMIIYDWTSNLVFDNYVSSITGALTYQHTLSILINGKGRNSQYYYYDEANDKDVYTPRSVFEVEEGLRYRMRIINSAFGDCNVQITIEDHPMTIIATDGYEIHPVTVDSLIVVPGERFDIVIEASLKPSSYCIYLNPVPNILCETNSSAILKYRSAEIVDLNCDLGYRGKTVFTSMQIHNINEDLNRDDYYTFNDTQSYEPVDPDLENVDEMYYMTTDWVIFHFSSNSQNSTNHTYPRMQINNVEFKLPEKPFISSLDTNVDICQPGVNSSLFDYCRMHMCHCTNVIKLKIGKVVELVLFDTMNVAPHPMHMHGQSFRVLAQEATDSHLTLDDVKELDKQGKINRIPVERSVIKDTMNLPKNGYAVIRWKPENPGYWFFHCHVDYHGLGGMTIVVQVGDDDEIPKPPKDFPSCGPWSPD